ncbi:uncharacterized protein RHOBADRAFT_33185 [Rhodotorula graminis WP1]|uniref:Calcineurin-like phosphoesterase domain-containing protein n=1 Tax=Rhodotorula graminis (strain WP1) TaxID=578459 RepID=A0A194SCM9_RHOGW|nr:uncharacterized protein RHOBADRAFT_33185 [Rhodotorula graminis WP1]KPV78488.1 hypothetical protein RHOBADRAFT_33185 [Rhodotorula graminis WP1]
MKPLFLHYKLSPQADILAARKADGSNGSAGDFEPITELDVLYGSSEVHPLPGFVKVEPPVSGGEDDTERVGTGTGKGKPLSPSPVLRFNNFGNFTILQAADLHLSVGPGECRDLDEVRAIECRAVGADVYSLKWLETALDMVKPDLVVFSGDQLNGQKTSWDARSVILKWAPLLWKRNIPWTVVFGNHDEEETDLNHEKQMALMTRLPLFVGEAGPTNVAGTGNYVRSIRSPEAARDDATLFNLYFLDSHANAKKLTPWGNPGYDYLKADQINWFRGRSSQMQPLLRPYTPPRKLTGYSSQGEGAASSDDEYAAKPNAMVFFHIPLRTAYDADIDVAPSGKRLRIGQRLEGDGASKTDSRFFEQAILAQGELPASAPTTGRPEVKVLAHGHCHISSDCRRVKGVWICFGGGATYSGYGNPAFARRMRVYQLSDFGERIETYQVTDERERINYAMLVGDGSVEEQ